MRRTFLPWIELQKDELNWDVLSLFTKEMDILQQNREKINWSYLSINKNA